MSQASPAIGPGSHLGRYRLVAKVASGGMGDVYRALDTALEREVAVKILPPEAVATVDRRRRFETEAKSAATVSHPNLVPVFDVGECNGVPYIVQELVPGQTISQILEDRGALSVERVAEWGAQAAEGLAKAHEAGILHRDVKPGNLIVGSDGRLRVLDFGLAKMLNVTRRAGKDEMSLTNDGFVVGTVHYMSPEQALGRELDPRSDAFSLGIVLYEMVTGRRPFEGESAVDTMHRIAYEPARPFNPADRVISPAFASILEKLLEKKPDDRYQTLRDLAVDLRRFLKRTSGSSALLQGALPSASEPTVEVPGRRSLGRHLAKAAAALALLGAGTTAVWLAARPRLREAKPPLSNRFLVETQFREEGPVFSPDGRALAYASNARGDYDIYYRLIAGGSAVRLTETPEDERQPVFTPDGASIVFVRGDLLSGATSIWSVPTLGGVPRRILDGGAEPDVSRDGKRLLFRRRLGGRTALFTSDIGGSSPQKAFTPEAGEVTGARFSNDGRYIAFILREAPPGALGDVWKVPVGGGPPTRLTNDRRDAWGPVAWLPDDSEVLFSSVRTGAANIWMVSPNGGAPRPVSTGSGWAIAPSLSPDGRSLLVQTQRNLSDAWEYSLPDGASRPLTAVGNIWAPSHLPDGRLLYADWSRREEETDLYVEDRAEIRTFLGEGSNARAGKDGKRIYFSSAVGGGRRGLFVVDVEGGPARRLTDPTGIDEYPDPTPDESRLVFCRTYPDGKGGGLLSLSVTNPKAPPVTLFAGEAMASRAGRDAAVFSTCLPKEGCGVYAASYGGGAPRLLVPEGRWPALSPDGMTVYALTGSKSRPTLVKAPLQGGALPVRVFDFNMARDPQFWAIFTLDVGPKERSITVTRQRNDDDIVFLEGVFR